MIPVQNIHHVMPSPSETQKILIELPGYRHRPTDIISQFYRNLNGWEKLHYVWVIPVNTLVNLVNIALAPLAAFYHLLAATMYGAASLVASDESPGMYPPQNIHPLYSDRVVYIERAETHAILAIYDPFESIVVGIKHIFSPGCKDVMGRGLQCDEIEAEELGDNNNDNKEWETPVECFHP